MTTVGDVMTRNLLTMEQEATLVEAAAAMTARRVGAALVVSGGRLIGILTERDMLRAMAARVHTSDARVRLWMTADPITVPPDMDLEDAAQIMLDNGFRHLPVVQGENVIGVASLRRVLGGRRKAPSEPAPEAA
jgi:CBS domain-containing protein